MANDSTATKGLEQQTFRDTTAEQTTDNLHSGDFLSFTKGSMPDRSSGSSSADASLPKLILLKEQTDPAKYKDQVENVAGELANFISGANKSLDIAIYNFHIKDPVAQKAIVDALNDRAAHGVDVKLAYFQPEAKKFNNNSQTAGANGDGADMQTGISQDLQAKLDPRITLHPAAVNLPANLDSNIPTEGIRGYGHLMHNKYVVRDSGTTDAAVWTGSTNWTDDAFGSMENNIIQFKSQDLADVYQQDFDQLWNKGDIVNTGAGLHKTVQVGDSTVTVGFSPGDGAFVDSEIARRIEAANESVHISSMDISSQKVLQALADKIDQGKTVDGIYDGPQMDVVTKQWARNNSQSTLDLWNKVKDHLTEKHSPNGLHDIMHNKTVEIDDNIVITGSHNFTFSAMSNAENMVEIENPQIAKQYKDYINDLIITYGGMAAKGN
jgi:phosphatidylserine/phosphatidylglycerophosphate/cardiolipin synthase-like enzyme